MRICVTSDSFLNSHLNAATENTCDLTLTLTLEAAQFFKVFRSVCLCQSTGQSEVAMTCFNEILFLQFSEFWKSSRIMKQRHLLILGLGTPQIKLQYLPTLKQPVSGLKTVIPPNIGTIVKISNNQQESELWLQHLPTIKVESFFKHSQQQKQLESDCMQRQMHG